ncbi:NmrA family NAD(P)-binding protein [Virgisporangium aurantiacum]|uniref:NmrA family transcriptional regulator n=1 Tax=Virgisporangium aurantiacum TaxID=175570 RepID=A0A8J3Z5I5_9ACTN|nr:NAD(P)H-binding protein [Virgisporangium aurantiacum]GIJ56842.1 NmrA family transcriptional regulator [Virgisporangium aurantiacum]
MTIAVTTPTGNVGSRVVQLLVQAGVRPRVLVRDPARLSVDAVDVRQGDLCDARFVTDALTGVESVLWVTPERFDSADPLADMEQMGAIAAAAIRAAGVSRVLQISSAGADQPKGNGLIDGLARNEEQLAATGADLLVLRCGYYFTNLFGMLDGLRSGVLTTTVPVDRRMPWVAPRDVGEVAAVRLLAGWSGHETAAVHGPEDLSWSDAAATLSAVLARPVRAEQMPERNVRETLLAAGLSENAADGIVGMSRAVAAETRTERSTTPTTLTAWASQVLRPMVS